MVLSKTIRQSNTNTNTNPDKYKVRNPLTRTQVLSQEQPGLAHSCAIFLFYLGGEI